MEKAEIWQHSPGLWVAERGSGVYRQLETFDTWSVALDWVLRYFRFLQI